MCIYYKNNLKCDKVLAQKRLYSNLGWFYMMLKNYNVSIRYTNLRTQQRDFASVFHVNLLDTSLKLA